MAAVIVALGAVVAVVLVASGDEGSPGEKPPGETDGGGRPTPTPSLSLPTRLPSELPSELPSDLPPLPSDFPSGLPTGFPSDLDSLFPSEVRHRVP